MDRQKWTQRGLTVFPFVVLVVFLYGMVQINNNYVWVYSDALIIACVASDFLQNAFLNEIRRENRELVREGRPYRLGRPWTFIGFFFGILFGAIVGAAMMLLLVPEVKAATIMEVYELTFAATMYVALDFFWHHIRKPKELTITEIAEAGTQDCD